MWLNAIINETKITPVISVVIVQTKKFTARLLPTMGDIDKCEDFCTFNLYASEYYSQLGILGIWALAF